MTQLSLREYFCLIQNIENQILNLQLDLMHLQLHPTVYVNTRTPINAVTPYCCDTGE